MPSAKSTLLLWKIIIFIALFPFMYHMIWDAAFTLNLSPVDPLNTGLRFCTFLGLAAWWSWMATGIFNWTFETQGDDELAEAIMASDKIKAQ